MGTKRAARNEAIFREVNEQIESLEQQLGGDGALELLCECADDGCTARMSVPRETYERVRSEPTRFIVLPGHDDPAIESVVERTDGFVVVEKVGTAADVAAETDPRS